MLVKVVYCKMYEPGECSAPTIQEESEEMLNFEALPRYQDRFVRDDRTRYMVYDIEFLVKGGGKVVTTIRVTRRVRACDVDLPEPRR